MVARHDRPRQGACGPDPVQIAGRPTRLHPVTDRAALLASVRAVLGGDEEPRFVVLGTVGPAPMIAVLLAAVLGMLVAVVLSPVTGIAGPIIAAIAFVAAWLGIPRRVVVA